MKKIKTYLIAATVVGLLGVTGTAFAAVTGTTPAEITAGLTGKTVEQVTTERADGKTYGTIADEAGKLEEFKAQILEQKKLVLDQRVADGKITQEQADAIYNSLKSNQATCDGTGNGIGKSAGTGFGMGQGMGQGAGRKGKQAGSAAGGSFGSRMGSGTCLIN
ncbi:DUF2680 domain-containing protein [Desulfosporosinus hippei]|uniref:DUF2680 domain-containing protein n=1 Tax=Desulfosporosinus hippei DSM 8344 TaxID=1121419 RepID=A0A1G8HW79_9FIRM|nr:DUF2680 domain-containing protein [Desulfosporosinus hippei]SDI10864.1 Protein of unknown function [Desulfosporosinus hippei DSM 8344]